MKKYCYLSFAVVMFCGLVFAQGCSGDSIKVVDIKCLVKVNGTPTQGVMVNVTPKSTDSGQRSASGTTDESGTCRFITPAAKRPGVMPGDYVVTFSKKEFVGADGKPTEETPYDPTAPAPEVVLKYVIPKELENAAQSKYELTVQASGNEVFEFDIPSP